MQPVRFTPQQHAELLRLGVVDQAIVQLETDALPRAREILKRGPPKGAVLDELAAVDKALVVARSAVERLLNAKDSVPHLREARARIHGGGYRHMFGGLRLDETSKALSVAIGVVADAIATLPAGPVRHQSASPLPIKLIFSAVQFGSVLSGLEPVLPQLKPSMSPTSGFRQMVGICYEAIGTASTDPERAIRAYLKQWRVLMQIAESQSHLRTERAPRT